MGYDGFSAKCEVRSAGKGKQAKTLEELFTSRTRARIFSLEAPLSSLGGRGLKLISTLACLSGFWAPVEPRSKANVDSHGPGCLSTLHDHVALPRF